MGDEEEIPTDVPEDDDEELRHARAAAIPTSKVGEASPEAQPGTTEDLENQGLASHLSRPIPTANSSVADAGTTEDLENKGLASHLGAHSLPIRAGVAGLWTKADNIHNPFLRVLGKIGAGAARAIDTAGTIVAPGIAGAIPGSTMNRAIQTRSQTAQDNNATEQELKQAQTKNLQSEATARDNPQPKEEVEGKTITTDEGVFQWDPKSKTYGVRVGDAPGKQAAEGKTVTTDQGVMQWNPDSKRYDIPVGGAASKTPPHVTYDSGIPVSVTDGKKVYDVNDPKLPPELRPLVQSAQRAHGQHVSEDAAKQAATFAQQEKMHSERQDDLTANTKGMIQSAPIVLKLAERIKPMIDKLNSDLGPTEGRWSEFWAGKVGASKPEYTKLRTDVGLLTTKLMQMHVGSRGGEHIMAHFKELIDVGKQSPENLKAALDEIELYAHDVQAEKPGAQQSNNGLPAGARVRDFSEIGK